MVFIKKNRIHLVRRGNNFLIFLLVLLIIGEYKPETAIMYAKRFLLFSILFYCYKSVENNRKDLKRSSNA